MAVLAQLLAFALLLGQAVATPTLTFDVAAVKRNNSAEANGTLQMRPGGYFRVVNFNVYSLMVFAFRTQSRNLFRTQISGLPDWANATRYDIDAKMSRELFDATSEDPLRTPKVVRALLEERFKLRTHVEQREQPVYNLVVLKPGQLGPQIRPSTADCTDPSKCGVIRSVSSGLHFKAESVSIETLAGMIQASAGRVIVDRTGLPGRFDLEIEWANEDAADKVSVFSALQEQLGLKLEAAREPVDVVVIDHVEQPTED